MDVPWKIIHSVAFIAFKTRDGKEQIAGTCFFITRGGPEVSTAVGYAVTARHIIDGIIELGYEPMFRLNLPGGASLVRIPSRWFPHADADVDLVVTMFPPRGFEAGDHFALPWEVIQPWPVNGGDPRTFFAGEDVFIAGCFYQHTGVSRNIPLVRLGSIAALDEEPVEAHVGTRNNLRVAKVNAYLIETRSQSGLSGSPAFVVETNPENTKRLVTLHTTNYTPLTRRPIYLLGLVSGHFDTDEATLEPPQSEGQRINVGISVVVPYYKIVEIFQQPDVRDAEQLALEELRIELGLPASAAEGFEQSSPD